MLEQAKCYKSGSVLRDKVTRVIIVLFVGGQVTNVEQNKQSPPVFQLTRM